MTDAEWKLWRRLCRNQLGVKFRRQHPYHGAILDFVCLERMLVIEVDGGQHGDNIEADELRTAELERSGFRVLRFWNHEVLNETEAVLERIWNELNLNPTRSPCP
jgi:very-short-patch-repair endonuclease